MLLNRGRNKRKIEASWADLGFEEGTTFKVRDLWKKKDIENYTDSFSDVVGPHFSRFIWITPIKVE